MGYSTDFDGQLKLTFKDLSKKDLVLELVNGLASTRRMARDVSKLPKGDWGVEGEFYIGSQKNLGVIDYNKPPRTQPSLWLQWTLHEEMDSNIYLEWDCGDNFYKYIPWLKYLIDKIFIPNQVTLNGEITWEGEVSPDLGLIQVVDNAVLVKKKKEG